MPTETVAARAFIAPAGIRVALGNMNNLTSGGAVKSEMVLYVRSTDAGPPVDSGAQTVEARVPNWMRNVLYYAGTNEGMSDELPEELEVPVRVDAETGRIVSVDVEQAKRELAPYEKAGRRYFRQYQAPVGSTVHFAVKAPKLATREILSAFKGASEIKETFRELKSKTPAPPKPPDEKYAEQSRRTANARGIFYDRNPEHRETARKSALEAGPMMAAQAKQGSRHPEEFGLWLDCEVRATTITEDEADGWRRDAGLS